LVDLSVFVWNLEDSDSDEPLIVLDGMGEIRDPALSTGGKVLLKNSQLIWRPPDKLPLISGTGH
jgi:hypothetical protein